ncbi:hypothetical protein CDAR_405641 [Caerostris darwini]|uniref:Uncharacterized protein n=1 Tax=Caerostris darwini TaxID=1538125 RepID=A0AAV4NY61_9ARAC|nr:hypothetical protein CDAR_405641 [Caerostris darwini]
MHLSLSEENYNTIFSFRSKDEEIKDNQFGPGVSCSCPLEFYCPATNKARDEKQTDLTSNYQVWKLHR